MKTSIIPVRVTALGKLSANSIKDDYLDELKLDLSNSEDASRLQALAEQLRTSAIPVAFPTETVYGLGADATRSEAVRGIYQAKQRPSDNPLIVHFASLNQIRGLLSPSEEEGEDPIPSIYRPLIEQFWPGPLTILLPNPKHSPLAPEVTAGLSTFGARIPRHAIALALIQLADRPVAAPSANASTKPSPTAAEHVAYDLDGRIESIIDGGPCEVGVESTVVDGLVRPPLILRPGGISLEQIRACSGWENVKVGYKDVAEKGDQPRAPGMKYRHYSPKARVVLYGAGSAPPQTGTLVALASSSNALGVIRTHTWQLNEGKLSAHVAAHQNGIAKTSTESATSSGFQGMLENTNAELEKRLIQRHYTAFDDKHITILDIRLGKDTADVARGIFAALRDLDREGVDAIVVEGVSETDDHLAAAVMNRLKKAAETTL